MKQKHIDASREVRLWIGQIIVPAVAAGVMIMSNNQARAYVNEKVDNVKDFVGKKIHR